MICPHCSSLSLRYRWKSGPRVAGAKFKSALRRLFRCTCNKCRREWSETHA